MTLNAYLGTIYSGTDLGNQRIRLGSLEGFTEAADAGQVSFSSIALDDPTANLTVTGLAGVIIEETACPTGYKRIGTYFVDTRDFTRGRPSHRLDDDRLQTVQLVDVNAVAGFRILRGTDCKRPAETDVARVAWLLGTAEFGAWVSDLGLVSTDTPRHLDATDYRDRYPRDVLADCIAPAFGKNWFIYYDETQDALGLFYDDREATTYTSSIAISNVLSDITFTADYAVSSNTFPPYQEVELERDPSQVYDGVMMRYSAGTKRLYRQSDDTFATFAVHRDAFIEFPLIGKESTAESFAFQFLDRASEETDTIRVQVELPRDKVNLVRAGMRMRVRFSHLPGYTTDTYMRVMRRTVRQQRETDQSYLVDLELTNKGPLGNGGGGGAVPPEPWVPCTPTTSAVPTVTVIQHTTGGVVDPNLIGWPDADPTPGNLLMAWVTKRNSGAIGTMHGFTEIGQVNNIGGIRSAGLFYRIAQTGDTMASQADFAPWGADGRLSVAEFEGTYALDTFNTAGPGTVAHLTPGTVAGDATASLYVFVAANQYGTHPVTDTAPDGSLIELYDDDSYGSDPYHYAAYESYSGGSISDGVTWTQSPITESGAVGATFIKTAGDGVGGSTDEDCPPPMPGQPVAPLGLDDQVDCVNTVFTTPYPYVPGSLEVWVRNGEGELIRTTVFETNPDQGRFTTAAAPCCNTRDSVILTGQDMTSGNFEVLTSGDGRVLTGIEYGSAIDGSCLVVAFTAAASDPTEQPAPTPVPPVPTFPPIPDVPPSGDVISLPGSIDATGVTDVTAALLAFFATVPAGTTIQFSKTGVYRVEGRLQLTGKDGFHVDGMGRAQGTGATLKRNSQNGDVNLNLWGLTDCTNSSIKGFQVDIKNNNPNFYDAGAEWQHAVYLVRSQNIEIAYMTVISAKGDFVDVDGDIGAPSQNVHIHDSWVTGLGRNGVSAICVDGLLVEHCAFHEAALVGIIDCEPNLAGQACTNIEVLNCVITGSPVGSSEQTFGFAGPATISNVTIRGIDATGFTNGLYTDGFTVGGARRSNILMEDCVAAGDIDHGRNASLFFTSTDGLTIRNVTQPIPYGDYMIRAVSCTAITTSGNSFPGAAGELTTT